MFDGSDVTSSDVSQYSKHSLAQEPQSIIIINAYVPI